MLRSVDCLSFRRDRSSASSTPSGMTVITLVHDHAHTNSDDPASFPRGRELSSHTWSRSAPETLRRTAPPRNLGCNSCRKPRSPGLGRECNFQLREASRRATSWRQQKALRSRGKRHKHTPKYTTNPGQDLGHVVEEQLKGHAETSKVKK